VAEELDLTETQTASEYQHVKHKTVKEHVKKIHHLTDCINPRDGFLKKFTD